MNNLDKSGFELVSYSRCPSLDPFLLVVRSTTRMRNIIKHLKQGHVIERPSEGNVPQLTDPKYHKT